MSEKLKIKKYIEPIKVDEPISDEPLTFNSVNDFTSFYRENQEEMDALTTYRLNKMYKVQGYRIKRSGKKKEGEHKELELTKEYYKGVTRESNGDCGKWKSEIDKMKADIQQLTAGFNEIIKFMNSEQ